MFVEIYEKNKDGSYIATNTYVNSDRIESIKKQGVFSRFYTATIMGSYGEYVTVYITKQDFKRLTGGRR